MKLLFTDARKRPDGSRVEYRAFEIESGPSVQLSTNRVFSYRARDAADARAFVEREAARLGYSKIV